MRPRTVLVLGHAAAWAVPASAQFSSWQAHQINTTICYWKQPRAALVRNTVYLDGGNIWWMPGLDSGELGPVVNNGNFQGIILTYNLSDPMKPDTNTTGLLVQNAIFKARGGKENGVSVEPNSYDGGLLANDNAFFLYGGALFRDDQQYDQPAADAVLEYQAYQYGEDKPLWEKGFYPRHRDDGVSLYVTSGAAVSAPSENKAWYFSGLTSLTRGPIMSNPNKTTQATNISNTLISVDMAKQFGEKWSNLTLPDDIKGRSNAEVVWVPVGKQGILVLGGVTYPEWATVIHKSANESASKSESPDFMRVIDIYDVAGNRWYKQPTEKGPGTRSRGCAVVASAADKSSFNIYYYGGFDGIHPQDTFYDDVWVLSLPSFTWTLINNGTALHARAGHRCFLPYPDQMMVFGGYAAEAGEVPSCLDKCPVVLFNITSGEWLDAYDPAKYGKYGVHKRVRATIGGLVSGGATVTAPAASGWATSSLGDVFAQKYDSSKIKAYWPYETKAAMAGRLDLPFDETTGSSDKRGIIIPAVVVPIVIFAGVGVFLWWIRLRRRVRSGNGSGDSDEVASRIRSWIRGQGMEKTLTASSSGAPSPVPNRASVAASPPSSPERAASSRDGATVSHHEMADTQLAELGDTSPPAELHDTELTPIEAIQRHSHNALGGFHSPSAPSPGSTSGLDDNSSFVSRASHVPHSPRVADSPQTISGARTVTTAAGDFGRKGMLPSMSEEEEPAQDSPRFITPPSGRDARGDDYLSAGAGAGPTTTAIVDDRIDDRTGNTTKPR